MKALLLFHFRVGVRIAMRASAPLFSVIIAGIMLQMYPAAAVAAIARAAYAQPAVPADVIPIALLAFLLPAWGATRLALGLNGWLRHLPIGAQSSRRGLALGLITVQLPLAAALALLAIVAHRRGIAVAIPALSWAVVGVAGALAALPVRRRLLVFSFGAAAAAIALFGPGWRFLISLLLLIALEALAGPPRENQRTRPWQAASSFLNLRIAWRALGVRIIPGYLLGFTVLGIGWLFVFNNGLRGALASGAARFSGSMACVLCISWLSECLAVRRPVWPLSRSFPWTALRRVAEDSLFLGAHALPLVIAVAIQNFYSALGVISLLPFLSMRAAAHMRRVPERRTGAAVFLGEGFAAAAILALLAWTPVLWLVAGIPALLSARKAELSQKVTRWLDFHHAAAGDTSSWSD